MIPLHTVHATDPIGDVAVARVAAARIFHEFGFDLCSDHRTLEQTCREKGLDVDALIEEIERDADDDDAELDAYERWLDAPLRDLVDHLAGRHDGHRRELARLIDLSRCVEERHGQEGAFPTGLTGLLEDFQEEFERHMAREEGALFPVIRSSSGRLTARMVGRLDSEHRRYDIFFARLRSLTDEYHFDDEACPAWQVLYRGLADFELAVMRHVGLEMHVLFPRALGRR